MRIKRTIIVVAVAALLCAAAVLSKDKGKASQEKGKVTITNNKFEPKMITVKVGSEVVWENKEGSHTVTADDGSWTSSTLTAGQTYSHKFDKPGKYPYYCTFHGAKGGRNMAGAVNVTR
jgi:plastocyanin